MRFYPTVRLTIQLSTSLLTLQTLSELTALGPSAYAGLPLDPVEYWGLNGKTSAFSLLTLIYATILPANGLSLILKVRIRIHSIAGLYNEIKCPKCGRTVVKRWSPDRL